jgi:hypothetical protein
MSRAKKWMAEETTNAFGGGEGQACNEDKTVILMTKPTTKEIFIAGKKSEGFPSMEVAENLFKILPLRATEVSPDLLWTQACLP